MHRTPRPWAVLAAIVLLTAAGGCRRAPPPSPSPPASSAPAAAPADGLRARLELPTAPAVGPVPVAVYLLDGSQGAAGATVTVRVAPVDATGGVDATGQRAAPATLAAPEVEPGLYRAEQVPLPAPGRWRVTAQVRLPDGRSRTLERTVDVPAP